MKKGAGATDARAPFRRSNEGIGYQPTPLSACNTSIPPSQVISPAT